MNFYNLLILSFTKKRAKFRDSIKILSIISYMKQLAKINLFYISICFFYILIIFTLLNFFQITFILINMQG